MAFTDDQLLEVRTWIQWTPPTDADLDAAHDRLGGGLYRVIVNELDKRYVGMVTTPAAFTIVGDYSQNTAANIAAFEKLLIRARGLLVLEDADLAGTFTTARLVRRDPVRDCARP